MHLPPPLCIHVLRLDFIFKFSLCPSSLTGLANNEAKMTVPEIWTLSCGKYHGGSKHMDSVYTGNDGSSLLAVSVPRDGGSIMTYPYIFDDRLDLAQQSTVRAPVF